MLQIQRTPPVADVVVVGSGAGGGTAVKVLTDLGINVTLLEAGPMLNPYTDFKEHMLPYEVDHRAPAPMPSAISVNSNGVISPPPTVTGIFPVSPTPLPPIVNSVGSARAS